MKKGQHSALYQYIEQMQGKQPWGSVLDAGTGENSLRWVSDLQTEQWTAVTGSNIEANRTKSAVGDAIRTQDRLLVGNWVDQNLLKSEVFDTVFSDYLLGAVEGFAPCFQPYLYKRLRPHVRTRLYATGLEPYVPIAPPQEPAGKVLWEIGRFRDACVLLKGNVPYREYPAPWVLEHLRLSGFKVIDVKHFNIKYKLPFVDAQIQIATHGLEKFVAPDLVASLIAQAERLKEQALEIIEQEGALRFCRNYVITAEPI